MGKEKKHVLKWIPSFASGFALFSAFYVLFIRAVDVASILLAVSMAFLSGILIAVSIENIE